MDPPRAPRLWSGSDALRGDIFRSHDVHKLLAGFRPRYSATVS